MVDVTPLLRQPPPRSRIVDLANILLERYARRAAGLGGIATDAISIQLAAAGGSQNSPLLPQRSYVGGDDRPTS